MVRSLRARVLISAGFLGVFFAPAILVAGAMGEEPLANYLLVLIASRFLALVGGSLSGYDELIGRTALAAVILLLVLLCMLAITAVVPMPQGGIDAALLDRLIPWDASGAWEREPQRAMATIVVYCIAMVCIELLWIGPHVQRRPRVHANHAGS